MTSRFGHYPIFAVCLLLVIVNIPLNAHASSSRPRINTEARSIDDLSDKASSLQPTVIFRFNFGQTHQRAFFATMPPGKNTDGVLTQESRTGLTAVSISTAKVKSLTKLLADFTTTTAYAKPGRHWSCQNPLEISFAQKTTLRRCQELLTPVHKKELAKLVNKLSLESKR